MKKTLKLTSLLFTLILAVSVVFTGCGNGRKDSTTKGTTENNNASGTTEDNLVDDAEDAVDDVADGVGDAVDDIANGKYSLMGQNADEFPQSAMLGDNAVRVEMDAQVLLGGINRAVFATADDELRPVMNGIYFDITTEDITMVASDGHKLVRCKTLAAKGNERAAFILPKKPANLMKNLLPKEQGMVTIEFDERNAVVTLENYRMVCRLIEGRYPNYNSVIPQNNPYKVTVDRQQLIGALRRVSIFSSQASSLIKLRMQENQIVISAQDIDFSTSAEETQTCQYAGNPMSIGFKSTFLIDILNNISADEVVIELADPSRAGVIVPVEQEENEDLLMLLMPMMLND